MDLVEIAFGADAAFAMPLAVALASVGKTATRPVRAWVLHASLSPELRARVERGVRDTHVTIEWVDGAAITDLADVPATQRYPSATFFRLVLPDVLPADARRVIYFDSDIIAVDDVTPLADADLGGRASGGVRDIGYPWIACSRGVPHWREAGLDPSLPYFNSGVLVMDLDVWRRECLGRRIIDYLAEHGSLYFADQDAVNVVLAGRIAELAPRWNQHPSIHQPAGLCHVVFSRTQVDEARDDPAVIHYLTRDKPWKDGCTHPDRARWFTELDRTDWAGWRPERPGLAQRGWQRVRRSAAVLVKG